MKISHRVAVPPWYAVPESDSVNDDYAAQVQRSTERGERDFRQAQEQLRRAEQRLAKAQAQKATAAQKRLVKRLEMLIIERRAELSEIERLMIPAKADRTLMLRTGRDDHLELGIPKCAAHRVPVFPMDRSISHTGRSPSSLRTAYAD